MNHLKSHKAPKASAKAKSYHGEAKPTASRDVKEGVPNVGTPGKTAAAAFIFGEKGVQSQTNLGSENMSAIKIYNLLKKVPNATDEEVHEVTAELARSHELATKSDLEQYKTETTERIAATNADVLNMKSELLEKIAETNVNQSSMRSELLEKIAETNVNQSSMRSELLEKIAETNARIAETNANQSSMKSELLEKIAETNANQSSMKSELLEKIAETNAKIVETNAKIAETNANQSSLKSELSEKTSGLQNSIENAVANFEKAMAEHEARLTWRMVMMAGVIIGVLGLIIKL